MRRKDESKKPIISDFINAFYYEHDKVPSVRESLRVPAFRFQLFTVICGICKRKVS